MKARYRLQVVLAALFLAQAAAGETQVCNPKNIAASTPSTDFVLQRDGTAIHKPTGLIWSRCALGQKWNGKTCAGADSTYEWQQALQAVADFNAGGGLARHTDWRLPNIKELDSIVETQCHKPSINLHVFPGTPASRFWSSTFDTRHPKNYALFVDFMDGYGDDGRAAFAYSVRLVRGGQQFAEFDRKN